MCGLGRLRPSRTVSLFSCCSRGKRKRRFVSEVPSLVPGTVAGEASVGSTAFSGGLWLRALLSRPLWVLKRPGANLVWVLKGSSVPFLDFTGVVIGPQGSTGTSEEELGQEKIWGPVDNGRQKPPLCGGSREQTSRGGPGRESASGTDSRVSLQLRSVAR